MQWLLNWVNTFLGRVIVLVGLAVIVWSVIQLKSCQKPPALVQTDVHTPPQGPPLVSPVLPQHDNITGVLHGTTHHTIITPNPRDTTKKDTVVQEEKFTIYIPSDGPPFVSGDSSVSFVYQPVREPYVKFGLRWFLGAGVNEGLSPTPVGMVSGVSLFSAVHLGIGLDRFGGKLSGAGEIGRGWAIGLGWNALPFKDQKHGVTVSLLWCF